MKIETKFNIGDKVWYDCAGEADKCVIASITVEVFNGEANVYYAIEKCLSRTDIHEDLLFRTKQELLDSL